MRFSRMPRAESRPITPRRLAASERYLKKQIAKAGLFAEEVAAELPTAAERIENHDSGYQEWWQKMRDTAAATWRKQRARLRRYPADEQRQILTAWAASGVPGDAVNFGMFLTSWEKNRVERARPVDDIERGYLARVQDWTRAIDFEPRERLILYAMQQRGLITKRVEGDLIEWKAVQCGT